MGSFAGGGWLLIVLALVLAGVIIFQANKNRVNGVGGQTPTGPGQQLAAVMNGAQVIPQVPTLTSTAGGQSQLLLSTDQRTLQYNVVVANLTGPITSASFNDGMIGSNGPVLRDITNEFRQQVNAPGISGNLAGAWTGLTSALVAKLLAGHIYLTVATQQNPNGEIRGQIQT